MGSPITEGEYEDKTDNMPEQETKFREFVYSFLEYIEDHQISGIEVKVFAMSLIYSRNINFAHIFILSLFSI